MRIAPGPNGGVGFSYAMKAPIAFQPALAKGNVYAGTSDGAPGAATGPSEPAALIRS